MRPLLWVWKSHAKLTAALCAMGHQVAESSIPKLLEQLHYRRQMNRKTKEGGHHPDRDAQFEHINHQAMAFQAAGQPVISVDTKKKELIGDYKRVLDVGWMTRCVRDLGDAGNQSCGSRT
jgi:hypothetical protein